MESQRIQTMTGTFEQGCTQSKCADIIIVILGVECGKRSLELRRSSM